MSWNYRIIRIDRPGGGESFEIHEAYYDTDLVDEFERDRRKHPTAVSPDIHSSLGLTTKELRRDVEFMLSAFEHPILNGSAYNIPPPPSRGNRSKSALTEELGQRIREVEREARDLRKAFTEADHERVQLHKQIAELRVAMNGKAVHG